MHLEDLARWMREHGFAAPSIADVAVAYLEDHRLAWNYRSPRRKSGAANVVAAPGQRVPGVVLTVDETTLAALDRKEGHPNRYTRGEAPVTLALETGGTTLGWVYRVTEAWLLEEPVWPSRAYLDLIIEGALQDKAYAEAIRAMGAEGSQ